MLHRTVRGGSQWWGGVGLTLLAVLLTVWHHSAQARGGAALPERAALAVLWPLQSASAAVWSGAEGGVREAVQSLTQRRHLVAENERLRAQVQELQSQLTKLHEAIMQMRSFKVATGQDLPVAEPVTARVIGRSSGGSSVLWDVEATMGRELREGDAVCTRAGLVGRVEQASGTHGKVRVITDPEHAFRGVDSRSRCDGTVMGRNPFEDRSDCLTFCRLKLDADVRVDDRIYTAEGNLTYPAGLPVGVVDEVSRERPGQEFKTALIRPFADLSRLDWVLVERRP